MVHLQMQKAALVGFLSVLLCALLFFGGAAQTATEREVGAVSCEDGYALWADTTDDAEAVLWSGSHSDIQGKIRSNDAIVIRGSHNSISGAVEYVSTFSDEGDSNQYSTPIRVVPEAMPVAYELSDYQPGGAVAQQAEADGRYHLVEGKMEVNDQGTQLDGLYYVRGRVTISASDVHGRFTIVAEDKIEIGGSDQDFAPYADGLLFFTEITGERNFQVSSSNSIMRGIIYAPNVGMELSGSSNTFEGGHYVEAITLGGSWLDIRFAELYCPQQVEPTSTPPSTSTPTATQTATPGPSPTSTATSTPSPSPTSTSTSTPGPSPTPTATSTPGPPPEAHAFYLPLMSLMGDRGPGEPNNSCAQAYGLVSGVTNYMLAEDRDDWYHVWLHNEGELVVRLTNFVPRLGQVALYRGHNCADLVFLKNNGDTSSEKMIRVSGQPAGRYFVYVSNDGILNNSDFYQLRISVDAPQQ